MRPQPLSAPRLAMVPLRQLATLSAGKTPSRAQGSRYFSAFGVPWVKTGDLNNGRIVSTEEHLTDLARHECNMEILPVGTVLLAMYGGFNQIGRTGVLGLPAATNQAIAAIRTDERQLDPSFLQAWLNARVDTWRRIAGSSRKDPNISRADVANFLVPRLPLHVQSSIATILSTWDKALASLHRFVESKRRFKRGMIQELLTGKRTFHRSTGTELRAYTVAEVAEEVKERAGTGQESLPVVSCSKYEGLVDSLSYFGKRVFSSRREAYKVVRRGQFAYPSNHIEEGSIGLLTHHDVALVSPIYTVFEARQGVSPEYLYLLFKTPSYQQLFAKHTNASVNRRGSLRWKQFGSLPVKLPSQDTQERIAGLAALLDREISTLERLRDALDRQRRAVAELLLTGRVRVPEADT